MRRIPSVRRFRAVQLAICVALPLACLTNQRASAEPAHFWISTTDNGTLGPEAPSIKRGINSTNRLYIWAQPMTVSGGSYNAVTNPFKTLENLSLNLVTSATGIDFLDIGESIKVYNPLLSPNPTTPRRFQYEYDSDPDWIPPQPPDPPIGLKSTTNGVTGADKINGMQAFSLVSNPSLYKGIGPVCDPMDTTYCKMAGPDGPPAWLLASVDYQIISAGTVNMNLQIGSSGMNHAGESSALTSVLFGDDATPVYIASMSTHRNVTLGGDDPDLRITACAGGVGDYNSNGCADVADYTVWRNNLGTGFDLVNEDPSVTPSNVTSGDYDVWKTRFGNVAGSGSGSGAFSGTTVPEPATPVLLLFGALAMIIRRRAEAR